MEQKSEVLDILYQQLQLLAEKSKDKDISAGELCRLTAEMDKLTETIHGLDSE